MIIGAVTIYLLIGTFCASLYGIWRAWITARCTNGMGDGTISLRYYFSFTTQATVGYGDVTVEGSGPRAVAITQAVAGQPYLVTVVALLVGRLGESTRRAPGG